MYCYNCGKEIHNDTVICPNCGARQPGPGYSGNNYSSNGSSGYSYNRNYSSYNNTVHYNTCCDVGFIVSIVSVFVRLHGLVPAAGILVSVMGLLDYKKRGEKGKGLAAAGIVISVLSLIISLLIIFSVFSFFKGAVNITGPGSSGLFA